MGRVLGLLVDAGDLAGGVARHDSLVRRLRHGHLGGDDGEVGALGEVSGDDVPQVEREHLIGAQHDGHVSVLVGDLMTDAVQVVRVAGGEPTRARGVDLLGHDAAETAVVAVQIPGASVLQVLVERARAVLHGNPDAGDARVDEVRHGDVDELVRAAERQRRFRAVRGEHTHP